MGLRIQNNIAALNAHRNLSINDSALSKSLERLSSGFRINRAADDAAGLAISQSFRADIASYKVATRNTLEASSLLQVAEGAMDAIGNMLTRLKELATQAASANAGSNLTKLNSEAGKLVSEVDRIADSTEYADTKLINGSYGVTANGIGASVSSALHGYSGVAGMQVGTTYEITGTSTASVGTIVMSTRAGTQQVFFSEPTSGNTTDVYFSAFGVTLTINSDFDSSYDGNITSGASGNSSFQVGAENVTDNRLTISIGNVQDTGLGINGLSLGTAAAAQAALDSIDAAISSLSTARGDIGAYMNRLSYSALNLAATVENVTAAESVIRDVDMASEMTQFTKSQILLQAGTAMLAQANMAPQQVLSLFG
jgi:flagellin